MVNPNPSPAGLQMSDRRVAVQWLVAGAAMTVILLMPALLNGFPLVFADTGGYLARAHERTLDIGRSTLYGAFLRAGQPLHFWPCILLQAAAAVWMIVLTLRTHGLGSRPLLALAVVAGLTMLTGLPWFASQLMPDIFIPLAVLGLYLLAFRTAACTRAEIAVLIALVAIAIAVHMSMLALAIALLAAFALMRLVARKLQLERPRLILPASAAAAGLTLALLSNLAITNTFAFTPGGTTFLFGRLVQDGIIARHLEDNCPRADIRLCAYRNEMPTGADDWIWNYASPLHKLGWWRGYEDEAQRIIVETFWRYPGAHIKAGLRATIDQLITLRTGEGMHSRDNAHAESVLSQLAPEAASVFKTSRQQRNGFDFGVINAVHVPIAVVCTATLLAAAAFGFWRGVNSPAMTLATVVLLALVANAAICGFFSNPNNRYQNRIVWLAPFALTILLLERRLQRPSP
jgi:hypothetical protein